MAMDDNLQIAHAVLGSLAWVIFFPCGAILMRVLSGPSAWKVHAAIQAFSSLMLTSAVGMGIKLAMNTDQVTDYHPIVGYIVFALLWVQALGGVIAHTMYKKRQQRAVIGIVHLWLGRTLITVGMIQGGLGLLLSDDAGRGAYIAYGVVAGVMWLVFVGISVWYEYKRHSGRSFQEKA